MICLVAVQIAMLFKTGMCSNSGRQQRFVIQIASDARNRNPLPKIILASERFSFPRGIAYLCLLIFIRTVEDGPMVLWTVDAE